MQPLHRIAIVLGLAQLAVLAAAGRRHGPRGRRHRSDHCHAPHGEHRHARHHPHRHTEAESPDDA